MEPIPREGAAGLAGRRGFVWWLPSLRPKDMPIESPIIRDATGPVRPPRPCDKTPTFLHDSDNLRISTPSPCISAPEHPPTLQQTWSTARPRTTMPPPSSASASGYALSSTKSRSRSASTCLRLSRSRSFVRRHRPNRTKPPYTQAARGRTTLILSSSTNNRVRRLPLQQPHPARLRPLPAPAHRLHLQPRLVLRQRLCRRPALVVVGDVGRRARHGARQGERRPLPELPGVFGHGGRDRRRRAGTVSERGRSRTTTGKHMRERGCGKAS